MTSTVDTLSGPCGPYLSPQEIFHSAKASTKQLAFAADLSSKSRSLQTMARGQHLALNAGRHCINWGAIGGPILPGSQTAIARIDAAASLAGAKRHIEARNIDFGKAMRLATGAMMTCERTLEATDKPLIDRLQDFLVAHIVMLALNEYIGEFQQSPGGKLEPKIALAGGTDNMRKCYEALFAFVAPLRATVLDMLEADSGGSADDFETSVRLDNGRFIFATKTRWSLLVDDPLNPDMPEVLRRCAVKTDYVADAQRVLQLTADNTMARRLAWLANHKDSVSITASVLRVLFLRVNDHGWFAGTRDWMGRSWDYADSENIRDLCDRACRSPSLLSELATRTSHERLARIQRGSAPSVSSRCRSSRA